MPETVFILKFYDHFYVEWFTRPRFMCFHCILSLLWTFQFTFTTHCNKSQSLSLSFKHQLALVCFTCQVFRKNNLEKGFLLLLLFTFVRNKHCSMNIIRNGCSLEFQGTVRLHHQLLFRKLFKEHCSMSIIQNSQSPSSTTVPKVLQGTLFHEHHLEQSGSMISYCSESSSRNTVPWNSMEQTTNSIAAVGCGHAQ